MTGRRLETGVDVLDRKLSGGPPAGSVIALCASPASQAELLLYEFTASRETLYLTTVRSAPAIADDLERTTAPNGFPDIHEIDDASLDRAARLAEALPRETTLVVDVMNPLEHIERERYHRFMNALRAAMVATDSLAVLHCLDGTDAPPLRDTILYMADMMFSLDTRISGESIENRLAVLKFRGGRALPETIKLELGERVLIDTSRDIA